MLICGRATFGIVLSVLYSKVGEWHKAVVPKVIAFSVCDYIFEIHIEFFQRSNQGIHFLNFWCKYFMVLFRTFLEKEN